MEELKKEEDNTKIIDDIDRYRYRYRYKQRYRYRYI